MRTRRIPLLSLLSVLVLCGSMVGCFGSSSSSKSTGSGNGTAVKVEHSEGDPSISAEEGGLGFTGEGWTTASPGPLGDERAVQGGTMLSNIPNWPENLRIYGTGSNTYLNSIVESLCYESLCEMHPATLEFVPRLASHWKIADDNMTFTFRIDPRAHWSDGQPVTSQDVIATYQLIADETLQDPMSKANIVDKMHEPVEKSKYIFEVKCKTKDWRNFMTLVDMKILPAHEIGEIKGEDYLKKYNFTYTAVSGPYYVASGDIKNNESLTVTRRADYWGQNVPMNTGLYNFDKIRFVVIRDQRLAFDKACKGELDFYAVYTAKWWVEDLRNLEPIEKGHLIRQKVFTKAPSGFQGLALNMRKAPFDDVRVRKAIGHLYDRKTMVDKFAYGEYDLLKSYYPGGDYENHDNSLLMFDPQQAVALLEEAGWSERGSDGILVKDGERLSLTMSYRTKGLEKYYTSLKEECAKAGVELVLNLITPETHWKNSQERNFEISSQAWSAVMFPSPRSNYHSSMADQDGSNNVPGFKSEVADRIIEEYDGEFDRDARAALLRQLDAEIFNQHPYVLAWYLPCERILYWNKFGTPETVLSKYADWREVFTTWWVDPEKNAALKQAKKSGEAMTPIPPVEVRPWSGDVEQTVGL